MNIFNTFVIADTHFGHENMRKLRVKAGIGGFNCQNTEEMNEMLIDNWNSVVDENDNVVVIGDFVWRPAIFDSIFRALHGRKYLVAGNHDYSAARAYKGWVKVEDIMRLKVGLEDNAPKKERVYVYCCHYPIRNWNRMYHGSFFIYGHTHADDMRDRREFNAGVDMSIDPYRPRRLSDVLGAMQNRWVPNRGGQPLQEDSRGIMELFRQDYVNHGFDMRAELELKQRMSEIRGMFDKPLGGMEACEE